MTTHEDERALAEAWQRYFNGTSQPHTEPVLFARIAARIQSLCRALKREWK